MITSLTRKLKAALETERTPGLYPKTYIEGRFEAFPDQNRDAIQAEEQARDDRLRNLRDRVRAAVEKYDFNTMPDMYDERESWRVSPKRIRTINQMILELMTFVSERPPPSKIDHRKFIKKEIDSYTVQLADLIGSLIALVEPGSAGAMPHPSPDYETFLYMLGQILPNETPDEVTRNIAELVREQYKPRALELVVPPTNQDELEYRLPPPDYFGSNRLTIEED